MSILIKGGRIINPATDMDMVADLLIENDKVVRIDENIDVKTTVCAARSESPPID